MKKKQKILIIISLVILIVFIPILFMYDHVHYDRKKDNIFEIPETYFMWESGNCMQYEKFYFIQYPPKSQEEMKTMIKDHIKQNKILEDAESKSADRVSLNFMIADFKLPIYFEENASYFKMDDFISHYTKTNRIALYTYDFEDGTEEINFYNN